MKTFVIDTIHKHHAPDYSFSIELSSIEASILIAMVKEDGSSSDLQEINGKVIAKHVERRYSSNYIWRLIGGLARTGHIRKEYPRITGQNGRPSAVYFITDVGKAAITTYEQMLEREANAAE